MIREEYFACYCSGRRLQNSVADLAVGGRRGRMEVLNLPMR